MIPPLYFAFPVGTLTLIYLGDRFIDNLEIAALIYQILKIQHIFYFFLFRKPRIFYRKIILALETKAKISCLSNTMRNGLKGLDQGWRHKIVDKPKYI